MKKVIGYVSTKDLGTLKEQDIKNLDVINIAFGLIERCLLYTSDAADDSWTALTSTGSTREPLWPASVPMSMIRKITRCF